MTKNDLKQTRTKSVTIKCTITERQSKVIGELVGILGNNEQDVVGKILTLWLYNEGYLSNNKGQKNGAKEII